MMLSRFSLVFMILGIISTTGCDANRVPFVPQPNRPPAWGGLVGIQSVLQEGTSGVINYGIAIDPDGHPVFYDLYWVDETETGSDDPFSPPGHIDSDIGDAPYVKTGLEYEHTYWFAVKAKDGSGLSDPNMNKMSVTMVPENGGFSLPESPVRVVFTDPQFRVEGSHAPTGSSDPYTLELLGSVGLDMLEISDLMGIIDSATTSIDLCTTWISNQEMVLRLASLANQGVTIRIVTEEGYIDHPNSIPMVAQLTDAGVIIHSDGDGLDRIMHENYWIIDDHILLCGSGDLLDAAFNRSSNNTLIFDTPKTITASSDVSEITTITDAFFFDFTQMYDNGMFGTGKQTMLNHRFDIGVDVYLYLGPNDSPDIHLMDEFNNIDGAMVYAINDASDLTIVNTLDALAQGGIHSIAGVYDGPSSTYDLPNGLAYNYPNMNTMNHRYAVIDMPPAFGDLADLPSATANDPVVITGSCNWTDEAFDENDETLIVIHDVTLGFRYYFCEFQALNAAANNTGVVYGRTRSAVDNAGLEAELTIETSQVSSYFPGTQQDDPVVTVSSADDEGYYSAHTTTGELYNIEMTSTPVGYLTPGQYFNSNPTFLLLPGASFEADFFLEADI